ncbi:MAG: hypothetical protein L7U72_07785 [Rubripirellula sp.]|nr:hypothetical protein [Rubripirellula sp.]
MDWQQIASISIVAFAAAWLTQNAIGVIRSSRRGATGGSCNSCHRANDAVKRTNLVSITRTKSSTADRDDP